MSGELLTTKQFNRTNNKSKIIESHSKHKVDINTLLAKVREEKNKEKKESYIFLGLICGAITVTGIIVSL